MELRAENSFTVTEKIFKEGSAKVIRSEYGPAANKAAIALVVLWAAMAGLTLYAHGSIVVLIIETVTMVLAALYIQVRIPHTRMKKSWQALRERCGDEMSRTTRFYDDRLEVSGGSGELIVNYEDIRRVLETEHLLILINVDKVGVMLAQDGFTKGSKDVVLALIEEWRY